MKLTLSKEWYQSAGMGEEGLSITAGHPTSDRLLVETNELRSGMARKARAPFSFGKFINLMRRANLFTIDGLAQKANIDSAELYEIEHGPDARVEAATVTKLAAAFNLSRAKMAQFANVTPVNAMRVREAGVRFSAGTEQASPLTQEETVRLRECMMYLSEP